MASRMPVEAPIRAGSSGASAGSAWPFTAITTRSCTPKFAGALAAPCSALHQRVAQLQAPTVLVQGCQGVAAGQRADFGGAGGGQARADKAADGAGADDAGFHTLIFAARR
jgi:hypothetical protein